MSTVRETLPSVLVTGASGYVGRQVMAALSREKHCFQNIVAVDIRPAEKEEGLPGVQHLTADVRSPTLIDIFKGNSVDIVVHLASIVTPGKKSNREFEYAVDVLGTENVLQACVHTGVKKIVITSSGAAYGYHADNPDWIVETDALRGNPEFAYSDHKRLVEEMLARYRETHPDLKQLVFRPGTILGETASNQITALFDKKIIIGLLGTPSPFVFIWDGDVVACILKGIKEDLTGIYNMAGGGVLTMKEIAHLLGKPYLPLPVWLVRSSLAFLKIFKLTQYGPEQVNFLRYRPVLSNRRLKEEFGYNPRKSTREVFDTFISKKANEPQKEFQE